MVSTCKLSFNSFTILTTTQHIRVQTTCTCRFSLMKSRSSTADVMMNLLSLDNIPAKHLKISSVPRISDLQRMQSFPVCHGTYCCDLQQTGTLQTCIQKVHVYVLLCALTERHAPQPETLTDVSNSSERPAVSGTSSAFF
jgi:hypothetical protein